MGSIPGNRHGLEVLFQGANNAATTYIKSPIRHIQVNRINLCKNVIRAVDANKDDIPPITAYPISAQVSIT